MNWDVFWKAVLIFTLCGYSILAIVVFIGGIGNIKDMLHDLRHPGDDSEND